MQTFKNDCDMTGEDATTRQLQMLHCRKRRTGYSPQKAA